MPAPYTVVKSAHPTLAGASAEQTTITGGGSTFAVGNRHATAPLWFRFDTLASDPKTAIVAVADADGTYVVYAGQTKTCQIPGGKVIVSVIGTSGTVYDLEVY